MKTALPDDDVGGPAQPLLSVRGLVRHFPLRGVMPGRPGGSVKAVDEVSFDIRKGETLGVVGESGCGKSTTARLLTQLAKPDRGEFVFDAETVGSHALPLRRYRSQVQMVFQDSYSSLNPRMTIEDSIAFAPRVHGVSRREAVERAHRLLMRVGLDPARFAGRFPHELSGGQRQRVNIARALALRPRLVVLDEAVSALDKSVEAQVLNLLLDLKEEFGLTYLFISHDLSVVQYLCDRVLVMYLGKVVEIGDTEQIFARPAHPYTRALLSSVPSMDPDRRTLTAPLAGDPPNPVDPPAGCHFHPRCSHAEAVCATRRPTLRTTDEAGGGEVACLMYEPGSTHSAAPHAVSGAAARPGSLAA
ncbi:dipeptide/oligopeptide/nickel ABC transporter ATP-binding protein [Burkholderia sp. WAC0059]|uniref:ABC transporter ATP-binding protein n=1 Tax=Burkholderia sp. WAC0059 TaxID=2066022 RepID=UPI000C7EF514|nr:ABC transporter ATP-binding protein [Burkholderia sp. WAC0059]PLZ02275.1 dipeptide/oligopeptide/nickel ABC transporter ATP-binding protein [Burkholderia sp. WAC0059]